eukprot:scaffold141341_cov21-Tisochrysis_lutea.AAC.2
MKGTYMQRIKGACMQRIKGAFMQGLKGVFMQHIRGSRKQSITYTYMQSTRGTHMQRVTGANGQSKSREGHLDNLWEHGAHRLNMKKAKGQKKTGHKQQQAGRVLLLSFIA